MVSGFVFCFRVFLHPNFSQTRVFTIYSIAAILVMWSGFSFPRPVVQYVIRVRATDFVWFRTTETFITYQFASREVDSGAEFGSQRQIVVKQERTTPRG